MGEELLCPWGDVSLHRVRECNPPLLRAGPHPAPQNRAAILPSWQVTELRWGVLVGANILGAVGKEVATTQGRYRDKGHPWDRACACSL